MVDNPGGSDAMTLKVEGASDDPGFAAAVAENPAVGHQAARYRGMRGPGTLSNDGKVIDDVRKIEG